MVQGIPEDSGEDQEENEDEEPPITERNISERNNTMSQKVDKPLAAQSEDLIKIVVEKEARQENKSDKRTGLASLARTNVDNASTASAAGEKGDNSAEKDTEKPARSRSPTPPPPPPEPKYNVVELLQKGRTLRFVFFLYRF